MKTELAKNCIAKLYSSGQTVLNWQNCANIEDYVQIAEEQLIFYGVLLFAFTVMFVLIVMIADYFNSNMLTGISIVGTVFMLIIDAFIAVWIIQLYVRSNSGIVIYGRELLQEEVMSEYCRSNYASMKEIDNPDGVCSSGY